MHCARAPWASPVPPWRPPPPQELLPPSREASEPLYSYARGSSWKPIAVHILLVCRTHGVSCTDVALSVSSLVSTFLLTRICALL